MPCQRVPLLNLQRSAYAPSRYPMWHQNSCRASTWTIRFVVWMWKIRWNELVNVGVFSRWFGCCRMCSWPISAAAQSNSSSTRSWMEYNLASLAQMCQTASSRPSYRYPSIVPLQAAYPLLSEGQAQSSLPAHVEIGLHPNPGRRLPPGGAPLSRKDTAHLCAAVLPPR